VHISVRLPLGTFRATVASVAILVGLAGNSHGQTITTFDLPNSTYTITQAINPAGQITGYNLDGSGLHGFLRQPDGTITTFNVIRDGFQLDTLPTAINPTGQIVGYYHTLGLTTHSFLRQPDGTITLFSVRPTQATSEAINPAPLIAFGGDGDAASGINQRGQIIGVSGNGLYFGFLRQRDGTATTFNLTPETRIPNTQPQAINGAGQITGWYSDGSGYSAAFLRQPGGSIVTFKVPGSTSTQAQAINSSGQITGSYFGVDNADHGFLRQPGGSMTTFDPPGSVNTQAAAINGTGQITGYYLDADGTYHGFVRQPNGTITTFDASGAGSGNYRGTFAMAINASGQIAGYYIGPDNIYHGFVRGQ
jgi:hypothetical protein